MQYHNPEYHNLAAETFEGEHLFSLEHDLASAEAALTGIKVEGHGGSVVTALAISGIELTRSQLLKLWALADVRDRRAKRYTAQTIQPLLDTLVANGQLICDGSRYSTSRPVACHLPWKLFEQRQPFRQVCQHLASVVSEWSEWSGRRGATPWLRAHALLRLAFFQNDRELFVRNARYLDDDDLRAALRLLATGMNEPQFALRHEALQGAVVDVLVRSNVDSQLSHRITKYCEVLDPKSDDEVEITAPALGRIIAAEHALGRGEFAEARRVLQLRDGTFLAPCVAYSADWLSGTITTDDFIHSVQNTPLTPARGKSYELGEAAPAEPSFKIAPRGSRKATPSKKSLKVPLIDAGTALYYVAKLARGGPTDLLDTQRAMLHHLRPRDARRWCEFAQKALGYCSFKGVTSSRHSPRESLEENSLEPLLSVLVASWVPNDAESAQDLGFHLAICLSRQRESPWLLRQGLSLLQRLHPEMHNGICEQLGDAPARPSQGLDLCQLIRPKPAWQHLLETLKRTAELTHSTKSENGPQQRLAWFVGQFGDEWHLEPRLQVRKGNGFSSGRKVALKKLYQGDYPCDLLDADRQVLSSLKSQTIRHGYYPETNYFFDQDAVSKLIGHPAVHALAEPERPLEVVRGEPSLRLERHESGYRVVGSPVSTSFAKVDQGRLLVFALSAAQKEVFEALDPNVLIPEEGLAEAQTTLAELSALVTVETNADTTLQGRSVSAEARPLIQLRRLEDGLRVTFVVHPLGKDGPSYPPGLGSERVMALCGGEARNTQRDLTLEQDLFRQLLTDCPALAAEGSNPKSDQQVDLIHIEHALELMAQLSMRKYSVTWPAGQPLKLKEGTDQNWKITANVTTAAEWLDLEGLVQIDAETQLELKELLRKLKPGQRFVELGDSQFAELHHELASRLERLRAFQRDDTAGPTETQFHSLAALALRGEPRVAMKGDAAWKKRTSEIDQAFAGAVKIPRGLKAKLRDYQEQGIGWAIRLSRLGLGACLADDMGLGKTMQALAVLLHRASLGPALVVAPASVVGNWAQEAGEFAPSLKVKLLRDEPQLSKLPKRSVVVATYDLVHRRVEQLQEIEWSTLILDEAQFIKNPDTHRAKAITRLQASFRLALSGTPVENNLLELWSLFRVLNPGLLGRRAQFVEQFQTPIEKHGDAGAEKRIKHRVAPFILRRTKTQVLKELPPKTELTVAVMLSKGERKLYDAHRLEALERLRAPGKKASQAKFAVLTELTRLRQLCCHPALVHPDYSEVSSKFDQLLDLVRELQKGGHRALIFSQFVRSLKLIGERLEQSSISYEYLDGEVPQKLRQERVERFQAGEGDVFLISLRAGGTGLNLTAADYVIHVDPWWNPAVEDQASDRTHRIGQERPVTVYRLIAENTIEEKLIALHVQKRALADQILSGSHKSSNLSAEELIAIIAE